MKKIPTLLLLLNMAIAFSQNGAPASPYYNGFNWSLTGTNLKNALATKITNTHTNQLAYSQTDNALAILDLDPADATNTNVLLVYGFSSNLCPASPGDDKDHRRRDFDMQDQGIAASCLYNREHTFPKALGNPDLGIVGAGADLHHLRASDKKRNADRDNDKFFNGSGNSFESAALNWYPGDEWKGDVARMMMYMYLRYGNQCLPTTVGVGTPVASDANMIDLFLQWNAEDPVSQFEDNRNIYLGNASNTYGQGNRNPFIDNPYLATVIWGGQVAQNRWPTIFLDTPTFDLGSAVSVFPNPSSDVVNISTTVPLEEINIITINGQILQQIKNPVMESNTYTINNLPKGFYFLKLSSATNSVTKKVLIN